MQRVLAVLVLASVLFACQSSEPTFVTMSDAEIAAYNSSVGFYDQVICVREARAGTYIRKRYCETLAEIEENLLNSYDRLNTLNVGSYSAFRSRD